MTDQQNKQKSIASSSLNNDLYEKLRYLAAQEIMPEQTNRKPFFKRVLFFLVSLSIVAVLGIVITGLVFFHYKHQTKQVTDLFNKRSSFLMELQSLVNEIENNAQTRSVISETLLSHLYQSKTQLQSLLNPLDEVEVKQLNLSFERLKEILKQDSVTYTSDLLSVLRDIQLHIQQFQQKNQDFYYKSLQDIETIQGQWFIGIGVGWFVLFISLCIWFYLQNQTYYSYYDLLKQRFENVLKGHIHTTPLTEGRDETGTIASYLNRMVFRLRQLAYFLVHIGSGHFDKPFSVVDDQDLVGLAAEQMRNQLATLYQKEHLHRWSSEGYAKFSELIRLSSSLKELCENTISHLVRFLDMQQGAFFVMEDTEAGPILQLRGTYAYHESPFYQETFQLGEGFVGQAALEKQIIYMDDIPPNYVKTHTGFGEATPSYLIIVPLVYKNECHGVIELASFHPVEPYEMDFLKRLSETIGAALANIKSTEKTLRLLKEAQALSHQLELRQKELLEKNQILEEKQKELLHIQAELEGQVNALNNAGLVVELHPSGRILSGNHAFYRHFPALSLQETAVHFDELLAQLESNPSFGLIQSILEKEGVWKGQLKLKNEDTYFWFDTSITAIRDEEGNIQRYIAVLIDITQQKVQEEQLKEALEKTMAQEEELRQNAEEMQAMLEELKRTQIELKGQINAVNNAAIVSESDPQGRIIFVNDAFLAISKYSREELIGQNHRILKSGHQPDSLFEEMWKTITSGEVWKGEIKNRAKDGSYYWITLTITPVLDRNGKIVKYIGVAFDITEQKTQAEQLQAALEISQAQEAELRQITAELQATHEEMRKTQIELRGQIGALNNAAIVAETDLRGVITMVNDAFVKISGYKREELLGKNHRILKSGYHTDEFYKEMWETIQAGKVWSGIFKNKAKDGSYFWVKTTITPVLGFDGKPVKYISVSFDITPQIEQEEKIRTYAKELERNQIELEGRMRALNNAGMVTETDPDGIITFISDETLAVWGYEREEVIGKPHSIIKSDEHPPEFFQQMWETIQKGEVWHGEVKNKAKDGTEFWVALSITPVLDKEGKILKYIGVAFDITAQKRQGQRIKQMLKESQEQEKKLREYAKELEKVQEKLLETQMELAAQINALNNAAIVSETDPNGIITFVNDEATYIWGYTREEVIGKPHSIIKSDYHKESFFKRMWEKISQGLVWQGQVKNRAKDGSYFWVHLTITPVLDENGKPRKYIGVAFDITAQKEQSARIREALRQAEAQEKQYKAEIEKLKKQLSQATSVSPVILDSCTLYLNEEGYVLQLDEKISFLKQGDNLYHVINSKEQVEELRATLRQSDPWKGYVSISANGQAPRSCYMHLIPIMGEDNVIEGILGLVFELLDTSAADEQLHRLKAENERLKKQLAEIQSELESLTSDLDL